jgi:hypothetical protein
MIGNKNFGANWNIAVPEDIQVEHYATVQADDPTACSIKYIHAASLPQ